MNLVQELQKTAKQNYERQLEEANVILDSVKANLAEQDAKDAEMLKFFGTSKVIIEQTEKVDKVKEIIEGDFITYDDIKRVCLSYDLRFLQTSYYKKEIPVHALSDLRKFKELNGFSDYHFQHELYIIAPKDHFELGDRPKTDPVILFRDKDVYRIISKWGNDFSNSRKIIAWFKRSPNLVLFFGLLLIINMVILIGCVFLKWPYKVFCASLLYAFTYALFSVDGGLRSIKDNWDKPFKS